MTNNIKQFISEKFHGTALATIIGLAALFLSSQYGIPVMLAALLLGLSLHFLSETPKFRPGFSFSAKSLLRIGVALLGIRISIPQVYAFGWEPIIILCIAVFSTILFGLLASKLLGCKYRFGILSGGSVGICGASAAMAISSVLPQDEETKKNTVFTVIGVTTLSTIAMILYPILVNHLDFDTQQKGLFLGATIHDVAQVTGAGYSISTEVGDISVFFKLVRVSMLIPIVFLISFFMIKVINRKQTNNVDSKTKAAPVPLFLIGFVVLLLINSFFSLPQAVIDFSTSLSSMLLITAITALGIQTSLKEITQLGLKPIILITSETIFIAIIVLLMIYRGPL